MQQNHPEELYLSAQLYHAHHSQNLDDLEFWLELARSQGDPVLELGCGTGRILQRLVQAGCAVYGLDLDFAMLRVLRHAPVAGNGGCVFQADMAKFHLARNFSLILVPCNTFSTLDRPTRLATLERVAAHLAPHGLFAFSAPNPELLKKLPARSESEVEDIFYSPLDGEPVQVSSAWQRSAGVFEVAWHYDHLLPDGRVERTTLRAVHILIPVETYREELEGAGLRVTALYGDFDRSPYTSDSPNLILLAASTG